VNLDDLRNANFSKLDTAVTKWDEMIGKLETLAGDMRSNIKSKADKAHWKGVNADVSRAFIRQTATEFDEMERQAKSIRNILRDAAGELQASQQAINERIEAEKDLHVTGLDGGRIQVEVRDGAPEGTDPEALESFLQHKLNAATTSDDSTADVLNSMMKLDDKGFTGVGYADRDAAAQALKDARYAAELAKTDPDDMSLAQFDQLAKLTAQYKNDPLYAERFATDLGPKKTLMFWSGIGGSEISRERRGELADFQQNLGITLGTATRSDSAAMTTWKSNVVDLGDDLIGEPRTYWGFQAMSNLMRAGDFDDDFLNSYGDQLMRMEKELTHNGRVDGQRWTMGHHMGPDMNFMAGMDGDKRLHPDNGLDPFTGFMKALSNSPEASTDFFSDSFLTKDEDHDFVNGEGHKRALSNFDYLFEEREWIQSMSPDGKSSENSYNAMGEALAAAVTGHSAVSAPSVDTFSHGEEQASLFEEIVSSVGREPSRLLGERSVMAESMGKLSAEYMPDISRALDIDIHNQDKLFPVAGAVAEITEQDVTRFLHAVGRDPEGYWAVNIGQHNYSSALLDYHHQNPEAYHPSDSNYSGQDTLERAIAGIAEGVGQIQGTIGAGRSFEAEVDAEAEDGAYNSRLDSMKTWAGTLASAGVGIASAPYAGPGAIVAAEGAKTGATVVFEEFFGGMRRDSSTETIYENGRFWDGNRKSTVGIFQYSIEMAGERAGNPSSVSETDASHAIGRGYDQAHRMVDRHLEGEGVAGKNG
jgi:hypothetical protein